MVFVDRLKQKLKQSDIAQGWQLKTRRGNIIYWLRTLRKSAKRGKCTDCGVKLRAQLTLIDGQLPKEEEYYAQTFKNYKRDTQYTLMQLMFVSTPTLNYFKIRIKFTWSPKHRTQ